MVFCILFWDKASAPIVMPLNQLLRRQWGLTALVKRVGAYGWVAERL